MKAIVKLSLDQPRPFVVLEAKPLEEDNGIELVLEVVSSKALLRIPVSVRNVTSQPVILKPRMVIERVSAATPVTVDELVQKEPGRESPVQCPTLSPRWEEKVGAQPARWEKMFSKNDFDVGCAKSAQH